MLHVGSYCGSLKGDWRKAGIKSSENGACLSSNV